MLQYAHFHDAEALRARFAAEQDGHAAEHWAAIARGRTFVVGGLALRIEWDDGMAQPRLRRAAAATGAGDASSGKPGPCRQPMREVEPAVGAWLANPAVQDRLREVLTAPRRYASDAEFSRALRSADRTALLDDLAKGVIFAVGGLPARLVWEGQGARLAPPRARAKFAAAQQAWRQQIERCLDPVRDELPRHRHPGEDPCPTLLEQFGPTWPPRGRAVRLRAPSPIALGSEEADPANAALCEALDRYVAEPGIEEGERERRGAIVKPKLLALHENGGNALQLCGLALSAVPDVFDSLPAVQHVSLEGNALTALPPSLGRMPRLRSIDLSHNALTALPETLRPLTGLTRLALAANRLERIPDWLGELTALTALDLRDNALTALPESLGALAALTSLNLHGNRIADLPASTAQWRGLRRLDWTENDIAQPPSALPAIRPSCFVDLRGNPRLAAIVDAQRRAGMAPPMRGAVYGTVDAPPPVTAETDPG